VPLPANSAYLLFVAAGSPALGEEGFAPAGSIFELAAIRNEIDFKSSTDFLLIVWGQWRERHAKALLALAVERGFAYWVGLATYFHGWAQAGTTNASAGIAEMRRGLAACQTTGAQAYVPYNLAQLGDMCRIAEAPLLGRELLNEAMAQLNQTEARYCESELLCIDGELRLSMPQPDAPEAIILFRRAIEIARRQNAKTTELRATTRLARLMADSGDRRKAHNLLAQTYEWFTEGFDTWYLVEARALLNELAGSAT
jgi:predicted ATPase